MRVILQPTASEIYLEESMVVYRVSESPLTGAQADGFTQDDGGNQARKNSQQAPGSLTLLGMKVKGLSRRQGQA